MPFWPPPSWYTKMALASFSSIMHPITRKKKMIQERFEEHDKVQGVNLASKFPTLNAVKPLWDMHEKQV